MSRRMGFNNLNHFIPVSSCLNSPIVLTFGVYISV